MSEFAHLTADVKVLKALELSHQGYTRQQIADSLYDTANPKNRLGAIRKLMARNGYVWSDTDNTYVLSTKQEQTELNNKVTTPVRHVKKQTQTSPNKQQGALTLTQEEILELRDMLVLFRSHLNGHIGDFVAVGDATFREPAEAPIPFTKFKGLLQGTTIQLHTEVWEGLDAFCKQNKLSKKAVVNESIWDFLKKWGDGLDAKN